MKIPHISLLVFAVIAFCGCKRQEFRTTFYLERILEESRDGVDPGVITTQAVIRTPEFWRRFVVPALSAKLVDEEAVRTTLRLSMVGNRDGALEQVVLTLSGGSDRELREVADAVIDGLDRYLTSLSQRAGPHVRRSKEPNQQSETTRGK
ncbi:MAG TPA: hypothetical protein VHE13_06325 [Opitutus sp.]|nr:hypothetical protein [Opitutus sp.]